MATQHLHLFFIWPSTAETLLSMLARPWYTPRVLDILNEETRPCGVIQIPWDDFEMAESSVVVALRGQVFAGHSSGGSDICRGGMHILDYYGTVGICRVQYTEHQPRNYSWAVYARVTINMQIFRPFESPSLRYTEWGFVSRESKGKILFYHVT